MGELTLKKIAMEKIIKLPKDEVEKVIIFMAGLDEGMRIGSKQ